MFSRALARNASRLLRTPSRNYLHLKNTGTNAPVSMSIPQPIGPFFEYRYNEDVAPPIINQGEYSISVSPYTQTLMYEYDNYHFQEPMEAFGKGNFLVAMFFLFSPLILYMSIYFSFGGMDFEGGYNTLEAPICKGHHLPSAQYAWG